MARSSQSTAQLDFTRLRQSEDTLQFLIDRARPDDAWTDQVIQAIPPICGASQRLFPLLTSVPTDCQSVLGHALYDHGLRNASEALWLGTAPLSDEDGPPFLPDLTHRQEALALLGFDWDARTCPACAKRPMPVIQEDAVRLVAVWLSSEIRRFGWPLSCRLETVAKSCPKTRWLMRIVRKRWEEASSIRFRSVLRGSIKNSLFIFLMGSVAAAGAAIIINSLGSWSAVAPSALPFVPAVWGVNQLTQNPTMKDQSLVPWSWSLVVGAAYAIVPASMLVGYVIGLGGHLYLMSVVVLLSATLGSTLGFAVTIRQGFKLSVWRQVYPEPGQDPTAPG